MINTQTVTTIVDGEGAVAWMRARVDSERAALLTAVDWKQRAGLAHALAAAYQDAHGIPATAWADLYKWARLAAQIGQSAPPKKRARRS